MLLLCVKQSFQLIFAVFTEEIKNDTSMCWPVDTTVYFHNSPISFYVASDLAGLLGKETLTQIQNGKCDTACNRSVHILVIRYYCFSLLGNSSELLDVSAWTNSTDLVCSVLVFVTFSSMGSEFENCSLIH